MTLDQIYYIVFISFNDAVNDQFGLYVGVQQGLPKVKYVLNCSSISKSCLLSYFNIVLF